MTLDIEMRIRRSETSHNLVSTTIKVGGAPQGITLSADGKYAYVAKNTTNDVVVITVLSNSVKTITDVGATTSVVLGSGNSGYVTTLDGRIGVLDTSAMGITGCIQTAAPAVAAALSADGTVLLVAHTDDTGTAIDTGTNTVIATLQTDPSPDGTGTPGLAAVGDTFYLTDGTDNLLRTVEFRAVTSV
jgi:DNA-binding beta-propeller fold protein YncE